MSKLGSNSEKRAEQAENLRAYSGIKLLHIKNCVEEILSLIGRGNIFDQYTKHDISHIDKMLEMVDWVIPEETQRIMTQSDWLMLVLAIYFHDMGLVVTKCEFENRRNIPEFVAYERKIMSGEASLDYMEKVKSLGSEADRFLYQEYVRGTHAQRISNWIEGLTNLQDNVLDTVLQNINKLLCQLPTKFRRDLALVCKSHHENDLDNNDKYRTSAFYGDDNDEKVNLHYICIILRTVDLLHITSDRTPSIQYMLISPSDPISIIEWKKQMAVNAVKPMARRNSEGHVDANIPKDAISVVAFFDQPEQAEAFFGLSSYISYMRDEIARNYKYNQNAMRTEGTIDYKYPWQFVDDREIEATGFEPKQLTFTIDQKSILKLLIGHTLYNDSNVVIRELIQNALDAIKLQNEKERARGIDISEGNIRVIWRSEKRELEVVDNGTGMTIDEINSYLLKVGASKYQTEEFKKKYSSFTSISKFGIGILTCFMVSDRIDIETRAIEEHTANQISIRSVNGKYLLKKLNNDSISPEIKPHGTIIKLKVRSDVDMSKLEESIRKWVLIPYCNIIFKEDNKEPVIITGKSCKQLLIDAIHKSGYEVDGIKIDVNCVEKNGISMAYAIEYDILFRQWTFLSTRKLEESLNVIGICIDGIRVEFDSPGYDGVPIISMVNVFDTNINGVQTNVARTAIERGDAYRALLSTIYEIYAYEIKNQIDKMIRAKYSLVGALYELQYLIDPLIAQKPNINERQIKPRDKELLFEKLFDIPCLMVEKKAEKKVLSVKEFVTINEDVKVLFSQFVANVSSLLRYVNTNKTFCDLMAFIEPQKTEENHMLITNFNEYNILHQKALVAKEAKRIHISREIQGVELFFGPKQNLWFSFDMEGTNVRQRVRTFKRHNKIINMPVDAPSIQGLLEDEIGVSTITGVYLNKDHELTKYIMSKYPKFDLVTKDEEVLFACFLLITLNEYSLWSIIKDNSQVDDLLTNIFEIMNVSFGRDTLTKLWSKVDKSEWRNIMFKNRYRFYDPSAWVRNYDNSLFE